MNKWMSMVAVIILMASPLRAQTGDADPDVKALRDMQPVLCDFQSGGYLDQMIMMSEFYVRMEYTTPEENQGRTLDQAIEQMKEDARAQFTPESSPKIDRCAFTDIKVLDCGAIIDEELARGQDAPEEEKKIAEGLADKARVVFKDMGVTQCARVHVSVVASGEDTMEGDLIMGKRARGWALLAEMWLAGGADSEVPEFRAPQEPAPQLVSSCAYDIIPGRISIREVRPADPSAYNCDTDPVEVIFAFTPDDPAAPDSYGFPGWEDSSQNLTTTDGRNPNREWVDSVGLKPGADFAAARLELSGGEGECAIVQFQMLDVDETGADTTCFKKGEPEK